MTVRALVEGSARGGAESAKTYFKGCWRLRTTGKVTKGGAAEPGVNVNGCQCQSVKFLMASDLGVERKSLTF